MNNGIENEPIGPVDAQLTGDFECIFVEGLHQRLIQIELLDVTDHNNELVHEREWLIHPKDIEHISLSGNLFVVESPLTGDGKVFVKCAPLPHARKPLSGPDLEVREATKGLEYMLYNNGPADLECWKVLDYTEGAIGRTRVLHQWQYSLRPKTETHRIPKLMSSTWGDRNRDANMRHDFILKEIDKAADLGVDVVNLDDGWQKGITANSHVAKEKSGVWIGFWGADPNFWDPRPDRFPQGLGPILKYAAEKGVEIGLWYAPDAANEFENWRKDADQLLKLHRELNVNVFKLDGIVTETIKARRNLRSLIQMIEEESVGKMLCDIDITAGTRPGYFGEMTAGPLFIENRYTDWHSYWPHATLRNLWKLCHWIDPRRMRIEFLNNARNQDTYADDPLAPGLYPPSTLFAITMFANPLGWFENTGLSAEYVDDVAPLVEIWHEHREQIFAGDIMPIGAPPDGVAWTGFCSVLPENGSAYALVFNEASASREHTFCLPCSFTSANLISGKGKASIEDNRLTVELRSEFRYALVKLRA